MKKLLLLAATLFAAPAILLAAALTAERDTPERDGSTLSLTQGSNTIWAGSIVAVNSSGLAVPGAATVGLTGVGRAERTSVNTGADYLSTRTIRVKRGIFRWASATNAITAASINAAAFIVDDQTVGRAAESTNAALGRIVDVDTSGVWVDTRSR